MCSVTRDGIAGRMRVSPDVRATFAIEGADPGRNQGEHRRRLAFEKLGRDHLGREQVEQGGDLVDVPQRSSQTIELVRDLSLG